jgi:hypothetical protein
MPLDTLSHLAVLCDMYDCAKLVKPWLSHWYNLETLEDDTEAALEKLIFVRWVFKRNVSMDLRIKAAKTLALNGLGGYAFRTKGTVKALNLELFPSKELGESDPAQ